MYGPLKPVGLKDPRTGREPFAVVQLRQDNAQGSIYNIVGFQTHLKWPEQKRVFSMIPGLERAEFVRYGVMHRNTYLDSPRLLDRYYRVRGAGADHVRGTDHRRGGICGVHRLRRAGGYGAGPAAGGRSPSISPGDRHGRNGPYISDQSVVNFQPMNVNFGLIPPLGYRVKGKRNKNAELSKRALEALGELELS